MLTRSTFYRGDLTQGLRSCNSLNHEMGIHSTSKRITVPNVVAQKRKAGHTPDITEVVALFLCVTNRYRSSCRYTCTTMAPRTPQGIFSRNTSRRGLSTFETGTIQARKPRPSMTVCVAFGTLQGTSQVMNKRLPFVCQVRRLAQMDAIAH